MGTHNARSKDAVQVRHLGKKSQQKQEMNNLEEEGLGYTGEVGTQSTAWMVLPSPISSASMTFLCCAREKSSHRSPSS